MTIFPFSKATKMKNPSIIIFITSRSFSRGFGPDFWNFDLLWESIKRHKKEKSDTFVRSSAGYYTAFLEMTKGASYVATALAIMGATMTVFFGGMIQSEVNSIRMELYEEMTVFRTESDDLWNTMVKMGAGSRVRRQSYGGYGATGSNAGPPPTFPGASSNGPPQPTVGVPPPFSGAGPQGPAGKCNCQATNTCPAGPAGEKGVPGHDGLDGLPGLDGLDGIDAEDAEAQTQQYEGCFTCPQGPPGLPGPVGRTGGRGMRGRKFSP